MVPYDDTSLSVCGSMSPRYVHMKLHPERTSQQGDFLRLSGFASGPVVWTTCSNHCLLHQEQHPYLFSLDFSSSHILRMRKHVSRPRYKKGNRWRQKANGNITTWQLQDVESNMGIRSVREQGRDVHLFFRRDKTKMLAAATKLKCFFQL